MVLACCSVELHQVAVAVGGTMAVKMWGPRLQIRQRHSSAPFGTSGPSNLNTQPKALAKVVATFH